MPRFTSSEAGQRRLYLNIVHDAHSLGVHRFHLFREYDADQGVLDRLCEEGMIGGNTTRQLYGPDGEGSPPEAAYCYHPNAKTKTWVTLDPLSRMCRMIDTRGGGANMFRGRGIRLDRLHGAMIAETGFSLGTDDIWRMLSDAWERGWVEVCYAGDRQPVTRLTRSMLSNQLERGDYIVCSTYKMFGGVLPNGTPPAGKPWPTCQGEIAHPMAGVDPAGHGHAHWFSLIHKSWGTSEHGEAVVLAIWTGGCKRVRVWPMTADGLARAQRWCDLNGATWHHSGFPVRPRELAVHADGFFAPAA